ncbi:MAG: hypothetical protein IJV01_07730 [Bacteroidales bacterium]|nr:hypothetical protein [Bacteroidales bacterium]
MKKIALLMLAVLAVLCVSPATASAKKAKKGKKVVVTAVFDGNEFKSIPMNAKKAIVSAEEGESYTIADPKGGEYTVKLFCDTGGYIRVKMGEDMGVMLNYNNDRAGNAWVGAPVLPRKSLKQIELVLGNKFYKYICVSSVPGKKGDIVPKMKCEGREPVTIEIPADKREAGKAYYLWSGDKNVTFTSIKFIYE